MSEGSFNDRKGNYLSDGMPKLNPDSYIRQWQPDPMRQGHYTIEDLDRLPENVHAELIDGVIYMMSAPRRIHQRLLSKLDQKFENFIDTNGGPCHVEPGVGVFIDDDNRSELIPDLTVICNPENDDDKGIHGAPDLVIEILSPSTRSYDMKKKYAKYMDAGVREYWMIDIDRKKIIVIDNTDPENTDYHIYGFSDKVPVSIYAGKLEIDFEKISQSLGL